MMNEVLNVVDRIPSGIFVDATLGGGSHSEEILKRRLDLELIAIDRDYSALEAARQKLQNFLEESDFSMNHFHH